ALRRRSVGGLVLLCVLAFHCVTLLQIGLRGAGRMRKTSRRFAPTVASGVDSGAMKLHKLFLAAAFIALAGSLVCAGLAQTNAPSSRKAEHTQARGFSDAGKTALSRQLDDAVTRGD